MIFTTFRKSRHFELVKVWNKWNRTMSSLLKNAHFVNINMKKRDLFEWYKDGCTKTCKNFLAWLYFFLLNGVLQFLPFSMNIHIGKFIDMKLTSLILQAGFISPSNYRMPSHFFVKTYQVVINCAGTESHLNLFFLPVIIPFPFFRVWAAECDGTDALIL